VSGITAALIAQLATACHAPVWMLPRIQATAAVESANDPLAVRDNEAGESLHPATKDDAITLANRLIAEGHRPDLGLMQIATANLARTGLTVATAFDPQANICAGVQITGENERAASCLYNTGRVACSNAYPERIVAAMNKVSHAQPLRATLAAPTAPPDSASVFLRPSPAREIDLSSNR
jgi:type IV secretion system protein VirB1